MRGRRSLPQVLILVITLTLVISPSLGVQKSVRISSSATINYPDEPNHLPRLYVEGTKIKDQFGRTVYLRGVNVDTYTWWYVKRIDEQQIIYMKEWGCNVLRITIEGWVMSVDFYSKMDEIISWAEKHGLYVIISGYHLVTGSGFPYECDISGWTDTEWNAWIEHWKTIATRYKGRINVLYDLLNEPIYVKSREVHQTKMHQCIDAIRAVDPNVICIVEAMSTTGWGWYEYGFHWLETHPINRPNIVYSGHMYQSKDWTLHLPQDVSKAYIRVNMDAKEWDLVIKTNRCLWVGEFNTENAFIGDPNYRGDVWLRNFMEICNEDGYAGFCAWWWNAQSTTHGLIEDWNGNPSLSGAILKEYLG